MQMSRLVSTHGYYLGVWAWKPAQALLSNLPQVLGHQ